MENIIFLFTNFIDIFAFSRITFFLIHFKLAKLSLRLDALEFKSPNKTSSKQDEFIFPSRCLVRSRQLTIHEPQQQPSQTPQHAIEQQQEPQQTSQQQLTSRRLGVNIFVL